MVSAIFTETIQNLYYMGVIDVVLPFLLFFTILFAVLQKTKVLGSTPSKTKPGVTIPHKNFNVIIALVIALMAVVPHVTMNAGTDSTVLANGWPDPVSIVNKSLPQISVFAVAIIMVMLLIGIVGSNINIGGGPLTFWMALLSFVVVVGIFGLSLFNSIPSWLSGWEDYMPLLVIILVFGLIIYFITKDPDTEKLSSKGARWSKYLRHGDLTDAEKTALEEELANLRKKK